MIYVYIIVGLILLYLFIVLFTSIGREKNIPLYTIQNCVFKDCTIEHSEVFGTYKPMYKGKYVNYGFALMDLPSQGIPFEYEKEAKKHLEKYLESIGKIKPKIITLC